jgi:phosphohistidine phosphatase SixA
MQQPTADSTRAPCLNHTRRSHLGAAGFHSKWLKPIAILVGILITGTAQAESLSGAALVATLRQGGCVVLMRHASSPPTPPTAAIAEPANTKLERQLDETGRSSALAMGEAIKTLTIPIGDVWSSPTYRAQETTRLANLPAPAVAAELGDGERSMHAITNGQTVWLQAKVAERPRAGTNTIIVTQFPNIVGAFGQNASGLAEGDALVLRPTDTGEDEILGRVKIQEWPSLASQR